ncbi:MAG: glycoside hydrolase family 140 protein [Mangrovibacterium sp.]
MMNKILLISLMAFLISCKAEIKKAAPEQMPVLQVSENGRFFADQNKKPFFWLGDTGWLLFTKLSREEAVQYLDNRAEKGFNVIQVMVLHGVGAKNLYGDSALVNQDVSRPLTTEGNYFDHPDEYDYWDHMDFVIAQAAQRGLYMALVPVWGTNVKAGHVNRAQAKIYSEFLAARYRDQPNVVWLNGGDVAGSDSIDVWNEIGNTLNAGDPNHLITFHPFGRTQSSGWFHQEAWLDFNMFQSGHRRYDQDDTEKAYGEDNWKYASADYSLIPVKPTLDGEPSYEGIPQGLHDTLQPYWTDADVRRYAYWSVFAGGCGFTYGHSAVMQFYHSKDKGSAYGAKKYWTEAIDDPGAGQMIHLKNLMLSYPYFERVPDQSIIAEQPGEKYDYLIATRGDDYAFIYTYNGQNMKVKMGKIKGENVKAAWYNPRDGKTEVIGVFPNRDLHEFDPPGEVQNGNDWVLVMTTE